jgi:hypothetical protein
VKATFQNGVVVEGTPGEVADLLRGLGSELVGGSWAPEQKARDLSADEKAWSSLNARSLWKRFSPEQRKLILLMVDGERLSLDDLKRHLRKEAGIDIAGLLAAITRHVRRETGCRELRLVEHSRNENNSHCYQLVPEAVELFRELKSGTTAEAAVLASRRPEHV